MNAAPLSPRSSEVTIDDLVKLGFTPQQIDALLLLKSTYPYIEYVENEKQWHQLTFLKWRFEQGDLQRS